LQALLTVLSGPQGNQGLQGGRHISGPQNNLIESGLVRALDCLQARPNFHEIVSTVNDYYQTLAHLSIIYGYPSLLRHLVDWHIDLAVSDVNGLTALHYAYMKGDLESVRILQNGGASGALTDKLGRTPSDLQPEGFDPDMDATAEVDGVRPLGNDIGEQLALGEQLSALELHDDNDLGSVRLDSEDGAHDDEHPGNMPVNLVVGGDWESSGGGNGQVAPGSKEQVINVMNRLSDTDKQERKNVGLRTLPNTPDDDAVSNVSRRLCQATSKPETVDLLTSTIFPSGGTSPTALNPSAAKDATTSEVEQNTPKYYGPLRRNKENVYYPADIQVDSTASEQALGHPSTKSQVHFPAESSGNVSGTSPRPTPMSPRHTSPGTSVNASLGADLPFSLADLMSKGITSGPALVSAAFPSGTVLPSHKGDPIRCPSGLLPIDDVPKFPHIMRSGSLGESVHPAHSQPEASLCTPVVLYHSEQPVYPHWYNLLSAPMLIPAIHCLPPLEVCAISAEEFAPAGSSHAPQSLVQANPTTSGQTSRTGARRSGSEFDDGAANDKPTPFNHQIGPSCSNRTNMTQLSSPSTPGQTSRTGARRSGSDGGASGEPTPFNQQTGPSRSNKTNRRQLPKPYQRPTSGLRKTRPILYERNLVRLQQRCRRQGADEGAIGLLGKIFANEVSLEALTRLLTDTEAETKEFGIDNGKVYNALLEYLDEEDGVVPRYNCRLCHSEKTWMHHRDVLRHLRRDHFGLADVCDQWYVFDRSLK